MRGGSWPEWELPGLTVDTCEVTSKKTRIYNCIAWAAGENIRNWWPDPMGIGFWPHGVARKVTLESFIEAYGTKGYRLCYDNRLEEGLEKIALFGKEQNGGIVPTHAALQLPSGKWTSKLGPFEDIEHPTVEAVSGPVYGSVVCYLSRPRPITQ